MPMFNFQCQECGHYIKDKMVKKHDVQVDCPVCNNEMEKLMGACSFQIEPAVPRG